VVGLLLQLMILIKQYNLEGYILKWAGAFRYLQAANPEGFDISKWTDLNSPIDKELTDTIFRILLKDNFINKNENGLYNISNESEFQRSFEIINQIVNFAFHELEKKESTLLWTISNDQVSLIPRRISKNFRYLFSWIQELILKTNKRMILIAPYFSEAGIRQLIPSIKAVNQNKRGIIIDLFVNNVNEKNNSKAILFLKENMNLINNNKIRVFEPVDSELGKLIFHAKLLLVDGEKGYLGSANYSERALSSQFELGVPLSPHQVEILTELFDLWIEKSHFKANRVIT
jgi:phosphatidylserine/phosphatidylglycerophosphate/cardiolipin synthase-like enzyme